MKRSRNPYKSAKTAIINSMMDTFLGSFIFAAFTIILLFTASEESLGFLLEDVVSESLGLNSFIITFLASIFLTGLVFALFGPFITGPATRESFRAKPSKIWVRCLPWNPLNLNFKLYHYVVYPISEFNISFGIGSLGVLLGLTVVSWNRDGLCSGALLFAFGYAILFALVVVAQLVKYFYHGSDWFFSALSRKGKRVLSYEQIIFWRIIAAIIAISAGLYFDSHISSEIDKFNGIIEEQKAVEVDNSVASNIGTWLKPIMCEAKSN